MNFNPFEAQDEPGMPHKYDVKDPEHRMMYCPECWRLMIFAGVMKMGNFITHEPFHFVGRFDCDDCMVIVSVSIDQSWAAVQWAKQLEEDKNRGSGG